jgi:hypothetical protein
MSSPAPIAQYVTPQQVHAHICRDYGTITFKDENNQDVNTRLWGGEGDYMVDFVGARNFENHRDEIDRLGFLHGCHTCGRFKGSPTPLNAHTGLPMAHWVCDHQPPLSIVPDATEWHLYPQCHHCSNAQWGKSIIYINSFTKHMGRAPSHTDQQLFWGGGRSHRIGTDYGKNYKESGREKKNQEDS